MAFSSEDVKSAIQKFLENPFWRQKFMNAPPGATERLALSFFFSQNKDTPGFDLDAYRNLRDYIEGRLTAGDLDYLIENDSNPSAQQHFKTLKDNLAASANQGGDGSEVVE